MKTMMMTMRKKSKVIEMISTAWYAYTVFDFGIDTSSHNLKFSTFFVVRTIRIFLSAYSGFLGSEQC